MRRPDYSHTYKTCAHSLKRKNAPWRVTGGCGNRARLFTGRHYELPNQTACFTCPFYSRDSKISTEERHDGADKRG